MGLGLPSIGGKDSMSGSFNEIDVPPTLVSFAVDVASSKNVVTPELKNAGDTLVKIDIKKDEYDRPDYAYILKLYDDLYKAIQAGKILASYAVGFGGVLEAVSKMAFGNKLGVKLEGLSKEALLAKEYGSIILEVAPEQVKTLGVPCTVIGQVVAEPEFIYGDVVIDMEEALKAWTGTLEDVFPTQSDVELLFHLPVLTLLQRINHFIKIAVHDSNRTILIVLRWRIDPFLHHVIHDLRCMFHILISMI